MQLTEKMKERRKRMMLCAMYLVISTFTIVSCTQDYYEKGEGKYSLMRADFCIVHTDASKTVHYAVTDEGDSLVLKEPYTAKWLTTPDSTYRALIYYNLNMESNDSETELINLARIPSATIHKPDFFKKGIKTDPLGFESIWTSTNRRYLNLGLILMTGETSEKTNHSLGIVCDTIMHNPDNTTTYYLRLYHDQGGVPEYYSQRTFFSIPIQAVHADSVCMTLNTYSGIVEKRIAITQNR